MPLGGLRGPEHVSNTPRMGAPPVSFKQHCLFLAGRAYFRDEGSRIVAMTESFDQSLAPSGSPAARHAAPPAAANDFEAVGIAAGLVPVNAKSHPYGHRARGAHTGGRRTGTRMPQIVLTIPPLKRPLPPEPCPRAVRHPR